MYSFFVSYSDSSSAPSFSKFAISIGVTLDTLTGYKKHKRFAEAWRECEHIRRDYLIDRALTKRFDSTFTKHLLCISDEEECEDINVRITVE